MLSLLLLAIQILLGFYILIICYMQNLIIRQKDTSSTPEKRQQLVQQISRIKHKISQLNEIQAEIASISNLMKIQKQKTVRKGSNRSIDSLDKSKRRISTNSNKKIKMYELHKKLQARNKDYKDEHVIYLNKLKKHEELLILITEADKQIRQQKETSDKLDKLYTSLVSDISRIQQKCSENARLLASQRQVLHLYQKQKIKKIQSIKKLKKIINQSAENTEPDDIAYSIDQSSQRQRQFCSTEEPRITNNKFKFELSSKNSLQVMPETDNFDEEILIQDQQPSIPFYVSFKAATNQNKMKLEKLQLKQNSNQDQGQSQTHKNYLALQNQVVTLEQQIQKKTKKYQSLLQGASLIKRGNKNLQASLKHSTMTLELLRNKAKAVWQQNQSENRRIIQNIQKYQGLYKRLRAKEGERGQLRGKLGIKVENTRILGIINQQIVLDLQKLVSKIPKLKHLSMEVKDLLKRVLGYEKALDQNFHKILQ